MMSSSESFNFTPPYHDPQSANMPTTQTVSWQTAFFSLVAVAVNTIIQNSGAVLIYPSSARISMRVSPILCIFDALLAVFKFLYLLLLGCSPRDAARHVWWDRFKDEGDRSGSGVDKLWFWNMVTFGLGALPQLVKLYSMRGIPVTQAIATLYFAPFVIMEVFRLAAGPEEIAEPISMPIIIRAKKRCNDIIRRATIPAESIQSWMLSLIVGALVIPLSFAHVATIVSVSRRDSTALSSALERNSTGQSATQEQELTTADPPSHSESPPALERNSSSAVELDIGWRVVSTLLYMPCLCELLFVQIKLNMNHTTPNENMALEVLGPIYGFFFLFTFFLFAVELIVWLLRSHGGLCKAAGLHGHSFAVGVLTVGLPIATLFPLFIYYALEYNPEGTWRPAWTEKLG